MGRKVENSELGRLSIEEFKNAAKHPVALVLDNIRSSHNIGAAFRTSDAFRVEKIYLCGICATPPNAEIHKAALGAEGTVDWEYAKSTLDVVNRLRTDGYTVVGIEQVEGAAILGNFAPKQGGGKYALVFGNEVKGIAQEVVDCCDCCIEIPQYGTKHSLNVSVSIGVVLWELCGKQ